MNTKQDYTIEYRDTEHKTIEYVEIYNMKRFKSYEYRTT